MVSPKLLFICGGGHSGSTILDLLLGEHRAITSVGEVAELNHFLEHAEYRCQCREHPSHCPFWRRVLDDLVDRANLDIPSLAPVEPGGEIASGRAFASGATISHRLPADMRRRYATTVTLKAQYVASGSYCRAGGGDDRDETWLRRLAPDIMKRIDNAHLLFDAVRRISGTPVILDSSKHAYRLRLLRASQPTTTYCLYLARDGRARTFSDMRREKLSAEAAARKWVDVNLKTRQMIAPIPPSHRLAVTYEELCRNPADTLAGICCFAGLENDDALLGMQFGAAHNIGGNRNRFSVMTHIEEDTRWRDHMSAADLSTFERIGGSLNRELLGEHFRE